MVWWDYIERVHMTCRNLIDYTCSKKAHEHLKLNWEET